MKQAILAGFQIVASLINVLSPKIQNLGEVSGSLNFGLTSNFVYRFTASGDLQIDFSQIPVEMSTTTMIEITANVNTAVSFVGLTAENWAGGEPLTAIEAGKKYVLSVSSFGGDKANLLIAKTQRG